MTLELDLRGRLLDDRWHDDPIARDDAGAYLLALKKDPCALCGKPSEFYGYSDHGKPRFSGEWDHIRPKLRRGGRWTAVAEWDNLTGLCGECNGAKGSMSLLGYLLAKDVMTVGVPEGELVVVRYRSRREAV